MSKSVAPDRLRVAIDSAPSGLLMVDHYGRIVLVNREIERLFDYPREDLLGREIEILVPDGVRAHHPAFRGEFGAHPSVRAMGAGRELRGRRRDGSEVPIEIGLTPVPTDQGMSVLCAIVDITARKRAEAQFRAAVESAPAGMIMVDAAGTIMLINREIERLFGYRREELVGESVDVLVPMPVRARHAGFRAGFIAHAAARPMGGGRELYGLRKDGSQVPIEIGLNPIELDDTTVVLASVVDISERRAAEAQRRQLEDELRQAQKLEALGTLAGSVAHDINNLLAVILAYTDLARGAATDPQQQADIHEIHAAAARGKDVVAAIRRFSERRELVLQPTDFHQLLERALPLLRPMLPTVTLDLHVDPDTPRAQADPTSVIQVLMNLCKNAAHAQDQQGHIALTIDGFEPDPEWLAIHPRVEAGKYVRIAIADSGHGMSPEMVAKAFEPFFTTKGRGAGTGLGLAMVRRIMREHRGTALITSEPGRGTTVECLFPAVAAAELPASPAPEELVPPGQGERVLLIDDEAGLLRGTQRRLEQLGYRVTGLASPTEAIAALKMDSCPFDVILTDRNMPEMTGTELARSARAVWPSIPVILLTGFGVDLDADEVRELDAILEKPVMLEVLARVLRTVLDTQT